MVSQYTSKRAYQASLNMVGESYGHEYNVRKQNSARLLQILNLESIVSKALHLLA